MILKYLRLRKRAAKDASGNSSAPRTGTLDLVNRNDRPFVRNTANDEAGLLAENGAAVNSSARVDTLTLTTDVTDGDVFAYGDRAFEINASDGTTVSNPSAVAVQAQGTITITGAPSNAEYLQIGRTAAGAGFTYTFKTTPVTAQDVKIGATVAETCEFLVSAINGTDGGFNTVANNSVTAANGAAGKVIVTAKNYGSSGNAIGFQESATNVAVDGSNVLGATTAGVDAPYFPVDITATAIKATAKLTLTTAFDVDDALTFNTTQYTAVANSTTITAGKFQIGSGTAGSITNLIAAINGTDGVNTAHTTVTAAGGGAGVLIATAKVGGTAANSFPSTEQTDGTGDYAFAATTFGSGSGAVLGVQTTHIEGAAAVDVAINSVDADGNKKVPELSCVDTSNVLVITHTKHGTSRNGIVYSETVTSAGNYTNSEAFGLSGTEGVQGAQRENDGFLYTCTGAVAANKDYTWKKTAVQNVTVAGFTTSVADSLAIPITHRFVDKTTGADAEALTLADGTPGQILTVSLIAVGGGSGIGTLTPTRKRGFTAVVLGVVKDTVTLEYVDDTSGWIVIGTVGVANSPLVT